MPPVDAAVPDVQKRWPSSLTTARGLPPSYVPVNAVLVSTAPEKSMRPITRGVVAEDVLATAASPGGVPYPISVRYKPFVDTFRKPSDVALPEFVSGWFAPAAAVGIGIDCTNAPAGVYSSTNVAV